MDSIIDLFILNALNIEGYKNDLYRRYGSPPQNVPEPPSPITIHKYMSWLFLFSIISYICLFNINPRSQFLGLNAWVMIGSFIVWQYKRYYRSKQKIYERLYNEQPNVRKMNID